MQKLDCAKSIILTWNIETRFGHWKKLNLLLVCAHRDNFCTKIARQVLQLNRDNDLKHKAITSKVRNLKNDGRNKNKNYS